MLAVCRAKEAREARWAGQSQKRQKMMAELEKREAAAQQERSQEDLARSRLQVSEQAGYVAAKPGQARVPCLEPALVPFGIQPPAAADSECA